MIPDFYKGEVTSALALCRRVLKRAGVPLSKTTGRYSSFGSTQKITHGASVSRVGCSSTISVHGYAGQSGPSDKAMAFEAQALTALRAAGLPFDDRGWLGCYVRCWRCGDYHDDHPATKRACVREWHKGVK